MVYARIIILLLLLVVSPIAFAGMILPSTQKFHKEWWESLIGQSFFLPAFLLFLLVSLKIVENLPDQEGVATSASQHDMFSLSSYAALFTPLVFKYLLVIGLFAASLMAAKKVQGMGSAAVGKISASITSATGGAVSAAGAFAGRNTIGRGANIAAESFAKTQFAQTRAGMALLDGMKGVAKSGFDARESRVFKGVASATGIGGDFDKNFKPQKDGFVGQEKRAVEKRLKRAELLSDDLTDQQIADGKRIDADMEAEATAMENMIAADAGVVGHTDSLEERRLEFDAAKSRGDEVEMKRLNKLIKANEKSLEFEKARVKASAAYVAIEDKRSKLKEEKDGIISAKRQYGKNLQTPLIKNKIFGAAAPWIIYNGRSADAAAAKKILKGKSDNDKLIDAIRDSNKS